MADLFKQIGKIELILIVGILLSGFLPTNILLVLDLIPVRFIAIIGLLYAITQGPIVGLLSFFLIAVLYIERNRRKVEIARYRFADIVDKNTPAEMTVDEEGIPQQTVPVKEFDTPDDRIMYYIPNSNCSANSNDFSPIASAESLNGKVVFPSVPQGAKAGPMFQREGFGIDSRNVL
jgi:hypothetical protein